MPVYLVTPLAQNFDTVKGSTLKKIQETEIFELPNKAGLLVNYKGTSFELSEFIGISALKNKEKADEPYLGPAMVTSIGSYFGRGPTVMWEWMQNRFENQ